MKGAESIGKFLQQDSLRNPRGGTTQLFQSDVRCRLLAVPDVLQDFGDS